MDVAFSFEYGRCNFSWHKICRVFIFPYHSITTIAKGTKEREREKKHTCNEWLAIYRCLMQHCKKSKMLHLDWKSLDWRICIPSQRHWTKKIKMSLESIVLILLHKLEIKNRGICLRGNGDGYILIGWFQYINIDY